MEDKIYLKPGDCVILRLHKMMHSPVMLVIRKENSIFRDTQTFKGFRCRWFTDSGLMLEAVFNSRDLQLVTQ